MSVYVALQACSVQGLRFRKLEQSPHHRPQAQNPKARYLSSKSFPSLSHGCREALERVWGHVILQLEAELTSGFPGGFLRIDKAFRSVC